MPIDNYCERMDPGVFAEPLNAVSNLAFFIAAYATLRLMHSLQQTTAANIVLVLLLGAIGAGSSLFHLFATAPTQLADVLPILLFQLVYLVIYTRQVMQLSWVKTSALLLIFFALSYIVAQFPAALNGSVAYLPPLVFILGFSLFHCRHVSTQRNTLAIASMIFFISLILRTFDMALCPLFPWGTHFLWHLCNGLVLYLLMRGLIVAKRLG